MSRVPFLGPVPLVLAALTAVGVALAWRSSAGGIASPGALSASRGRGVVRHGVRAHADLSRRCAACHAAPWSARTTSDLCLRCHEEVRAERSARSGLHGRLAPDGGCLGGCHTEHAGRAASLTRMGLETFPHDATGFSLSAHREVRPGHAFACHDCHDRENWRFDAARCSGCHAEDDVHRGQFGSACADCHGATAWKPATFDHARTSYPLTGAHVRVACGACHAAGRFAGTPRECAGCHEEPADHAGTFGSRCAECHGTDTWRGATIQHRFPLDHGGEGRIACRTCHPSSWRTYTCTGCHEHSPERLAREHRDEAIGDLRDCVRCHPTGRGDEDGHDDDRSGRDHEQGDEHGEHGEQRERGEHDEHDD